MFECCGEFWLPVVSGLILGASTMHLKKKKNFFGLQDCGVDGGARLSWPKPLSFLWSAVNFVHGQ